MGANGVRTYMGNRGDEFEMRWLKPCFDLGRSKFVFYSSRDVPSMREVIGDADIVINLVGKYYETKHLTEVASFPYIKYETNFSFQEANVDVPRTIAELCTEMQIDNLIHVSSLAADPDSESEWARTKFAGEQAVKEAYPWATIIRPSQIFGYEDRLLNWFAWMARSAPFVPLVDEGEALTQPVYMNNVADVISKVVDEPELYEGKTIDCFGPADYSYKELAQFVYDITGQDPYLLELPKPIVKALSEITKFQPYPMLTPDLVEIMSMDYTPKMTPQEYNDSQDILTMADMGVEPTTIEKGAFEYLHRFRRGGHFILEGGYHSQHTYERKVWKD
eukprot:CAMPEP_0172486058 /NCGR_PEP_ID=MMETSP1066-20121228/14445_1 /TAXON_ID=671091 /ORGANISM="Coscinodiscus wailesii, Strain CCMP2513" /LENGTH=333 /DNA_ID=CAMNT_0013251765 /DNA_START=345 /DNA_END=1346 /DNA_ORIENTATION=+